MVECVFVRASVGHTRVHAHTHTVTTVALEVNCSRVPYGDECCRTISKALDENFSTFDSWFMVLGLILLY